MIFKFKKKDANRPFTTGVTSGNNLYLFLSRMKWITGVSPWPFSLQVNVQVTFLLLITYTTISTFILKVAFYHFYLLLSPDV